MHLTPVTWFHLKQDKKRAIQDYRINLVDSIGMNDEVNPTLTFGVIYLWQAIDAGNLRRLLVGCTAR